jgi:GNAT superfamily N-acetyltransferase
LIKTHFALADEGVLNDLLTISNYFIFIYDDNLLISFLGASMKKDILNKDFPVDKAIIENVGKLLVSTLDLLWVAENYRGKGFGSKILSLFEKKGINTLLKVGTDTDFNYEFYKNHGYHEIATWKKESAMLYVKHSDKRVFEKIKKFTFTFS